MEDQNNEPEEITNKATGEVKKLNWFERKAVKSFLEKSRKKLPELQKAVEEGLRDKEDMIKALLDMGALLDIEDEETGEPFTRADYEAMTIKELTDTFESGLNYMEKNI